MTRTERRQRRNIFGKSYEYRAKYNAYKEARKAEDRAKQKRGG